MIGNQLAINAKKLNINAIILELLNSNDIKDYILNSNQERLRKQGIDYKGTQLRTYRATGSNVYSNVTINFRKAEGKQFRHVDLYDEGGFYDSFRALIKGGLVVEANFRKPDGNISDNLDVTKVLGFTNEDIVIISNMLYPFLLNRIAEELNL